MARLTLYCLGPLQLLLEGAPVTGFAYNKARTLLAYLAMSGARPQYRTQLAGFFWPDLPEESARTNLRQALADLREALGDAAAAAPFLLVTRETVQLNPAGALELDVREFQALLDACEAHPHRHVERCDACAARLAAAVSLYRGDFLAQFIVRNDAPFEDWALPLQEGLRQRMLGALFYLCKYHERRGAHELVIRYARRQLEIDAAREEAHQALMQTYARSGLRSAALAQFDACRAALRRELDVEPSAETRALYQRIRDQWEHESGSAPGGLLSPLSNLPAAPAPLIGRGRELAEITERLSDPACRLVTLTGFGGSGKTRLALAAAAQSAYAFEHGAVFVELAAIDAAGLVAGAVLSALRVPAEPRQEPQAQLLRYLADKELLLVLDNFEQLMDAAGLVANITQRAPRVTMLVTSRERLALRAEWVFDLGGLSYPTGTDGEPLEAFEAVRLFSERARQILPQFALSPDVAPAVVQICRMVEGLPLAIELAASGVRRRSCAEIAAEITRHMRSLSAELRDMPERQRSMWATLEQSWNILSGPQRSLLARLAVFRGGFELAAAATIAATTAARLDVLVEKSLLRRTLAGRYDMHELIRQYAYDKLAQAGEATEARDRHLDYYLQLAGEAGPKLSGAQQVALLDQLAAEHDNLRLAMEGSLSAGRADLGLQLATDLHWFWYLRGYWSEGRAWLQRMLAAASRAPSTTRARALYAMAHLTQMQRDIGQAEKLAEESLALSRAGADKHGIAKALSILTDMAYYHDDFQRARTLGEEGASLFRELGDRSALSGMLGSLGYTAEGTGDYVRARALYEESLSVCRAVGDEDGTAYRLYLLGRLAQTQGDNTRAASVLDKSLSLFRALRNTWGMAVVLRQQGYLELQQANAAQAHKLLLESLELFQKLGDRYGVATTLAGLACEAVGEGRFARAAQLFGTSQTQLQTVGMSLIAPLRSQFDRALAQVSVQLEPAAFNIAWADGSAMTMEQAIALALDESAPD